VLALLAFFMSNKCLDGEIGQFLWCGLGQSSPEFENAELRLISVLPSVEGLQIGRSQFRRAVAEGQKCRPELFLHRCEFMLGDVTAEHPVHERVWIALAIDFNQLEPLVEIM